MCVCVPPSSTSWCAVQIGIKFAHVTRVEEDAHGMRVTRHAKCVCVNACVRLCVGTLMLIKAFNARTQTITTPHPRTQAH